MRTIHAVALLTGAAALAAAHLGVPAAHGAPQQRPRAHPGPAAGDCATGQFCVWPDRGFGGKRQTYELSGTDIESCVTLPAGTRGVSFANRTGRPVTTYQSGECAETGEYDTYPGGGSWVPESPYQVRAFKIWES
ncbi:peptidase inhibitor family I36 protein [Streptomyces chrestomyceticus]|uniref:peptidase inhibitor family I36 protein n=1 Tax=Streptomyces chrestomyceticus TaxID=68185 RepID=UPI0036D0D162